MSTASALRKLIPSVGPRVSVALLILRIATGVAFMLHGAPKLAAPMSWGDDFTPFPGVPHILQLCVTIAENVGGPALILGVLTPLFTFMQICDVGVVIFAVKAAHGMPYVGPQGKSWEIEAHLLIGSLVVLICGPGLYSIDAAFVAWRERRGR
ncbi:MAG TPA: DoxX family protein [Candidatus Aquilonibacter sp.]